MNLSILPLFALLLSALAFTPLNAQEKTTGADPQKKELVRTFLSFYMSVGQARTASDPSKVVEACDTAWHLPDDKALKSLNDFSVWLLAANPTDVAVEQVKTAGDLARMSVKFSNVKKPHPSRAEVTLVRLGQPNNRSWKIVNFDLSKNAAAITPVPSNTSLPSPAGDSALETLDNYLKALSKLAGDPAGQAAANPQELADELAEWWVDKRDRSQTRAMTQGAMFFRLYQPKEWAIEPVGAAGANAASYTVKVQPGNEVSRRLGPKTLTFGLVNSDGGGWKISSFINPQLAPGK